MSLRDVKRARTRQALVDAATELFTTKGYEATTVADIAAAAEIGTRTFFSYFPTKEDLLFPEADLRVGLALRAIADRTPTDLPADVLLRALRESAIASPDLTGPLAALRLRLALEVPAVQGRALRLQAESAREIARALAAAFPSALDQVGAAALVGAFLGAVTGALLALLDGPDAPPGPEALREELTRATEAALTSWS